MTEIETTVAELLAHPGVDQVLLVGRDGILVQRAGDADVDGDVLAALTPGLASACAAVADTAGGGGFLTAVMEWERRVGILAAVSDELLLVVLVRPDVGFASLLRSIRSHRTVLAAAFR